MTVEKPGRIINVTHQIPYELSFDKDAQWQFTSRQNHHAMYGGIRSLEQQWQLLYIGWTGQLEGVAEADKQTLVETLRPLGCLPLFVDTQSVDGHYDGYCKSGTGVFSLHYYLSNYTLVLWPLFHYMIWNDATDGRLESQQWEAYIKVNQQYADFVCEIYQQQEDDISKHDCS
jgi:trehalose-6-phosphate synthase